MNQRSFASTGRSVSEVGLGTWQIGGSWGEVSEAESLAILNTAVENGVNFFDTADVYGAGRSERIIGRFLRENAADLFVATKLGRGGDPGWPENFGPQAMRAHTEASLDRLGLETLDLTQLHCIPTEQLRQGEVFETLRQLKSEGKIQQFGASVESMEEGLICLQQEGLASLQIIFNIFRQKAIETLFQVAEKKHVALIIRLPLASGLLSGRFTEETQFDAGDHRNFNRDGEAFNVGETFAGLPFIKGVELANQFRELVPADVNLSQLALRWILDYPAVTTVIPGASRASQVQDNVAASAMSPLSLELHEKLGDWYRKEVSAHIRGPY